MIASTVLKAMKAAGCSTDQIIAAVEADELASGDKAMARREADRIRKRRQRERESSTETVVTSAMSRVTPVTERDTPSPPPSPSPDKERPHTPLENNLFPEPPPQPRVSGAREFERFWEVFPNKVGKADASKAFDKAIKRVDIDVMLAGLDRYVHKTDDRPWCNPSTWLNQDRWKDQPATQAPRAGPQRAPSALEVRSARLREKIENEYGFGRQGSGDPQDAGVLRIAGGTDVGRRN